MIVISTKINGTNEASGKADGASCATVSPINLRPTLTTGSIEIPAICSRNSRSARLAFSSSFAKWSAAANENGSCRETIVKSPSLFLVGSFKSKIIPRSASPTSTYSARDGFALGGINCHLIRYQGGNPTSSDCKSSTLKPLPIDCESSSSSKLSGCRSVPSLPDDFSSMNFTLSPILAKTKSASALDTLPEYTTRSSGTSAPEKRAALESRKVLKIKLSVG